MKKPTKLKKPKVSRNPYAEIGHGRKAGAMALEKNKKEKEKQRRRDDLTKALKEFFEDFEYL